MNNEQFVWPGCYWIGIEALHVDWRAPSLPAPFFRKTFDCRKSDCTYLLSIACGGFCQVYLNGKPVSDAVLEPVPLQYDKHVSFISFDVTDFLLDGANTVGVILGNGWYNTDTAEVFHLDKAPWSDYPKFLLKLEACPPVKSLSSPPASSHIILGSDSSWCYTLDGPILFDQLRNGEYYDARKELPNWSENTGSADNWQGVRIVPGPGGALQKQQMPSCRIQERFMPLSRKINQHGEILFDFGRILSGWCELQLQAPEGTEITIRYSELAAPHGHGIDVSNIDSFVLSGEFQCDKYIASGQGIETWHPRFVYHGFQYVLIKSSQKIDLCNCTACLIRTDFDRISDFDSSHKTLNQLYQCCRNSYEANFTNGPTDCPHREKLGWTGDTSMALDSGFALGDVFDCYRTYLGMIRDIQRPSGQIPGVIPTGGWGFNMGSGAVYDSIFCYAPVQGFLYTTRDDMIRENYSAVQQHFAFLESVAEQNITDHGLGDWCPPFWQSAVDKKLVLSCFYAREAQLLHKMAGYLGDQSARDRYQEKAQLIADTIHRTFYNGNGSYAKNELTALALPLAFEIVPQTECASVLSNLLQQSRACNHTAQFGIAGAKYVPRVLAENGYIDDALEFFIQPEEPGWGHWMKQGATTLWENWDGTNSHCHVMFGDFAAWAIRYLAGLRYDWDDPGNRGQKIQMLFPAKLNYLTVNYRDFAIHWHRVGDKILLQASVANPHPAKLLLPNGRTIAFSERTEVLF